MLNKKENRNRAMRKNFMRAAVCAAGIALLFGMTACKQFTADIDEELGYWAAEVIVADYSFSVPYQTSNDGALCIPSSGPVTLTIKLRNPKNFTIVMPTSSADVIRFPGLTTQPTHGSSNDYTLVQTPDKQALQLTYKSGFLKDHEWGTKDIGADITLISTDGRKFNQIYKFNLEANTPPPEISDITIAKDGAHYVLCFTVQDTDMGTTIPGGNLHKDLGLVITKEGGETKKIPLPIESSGFAVNPADGLLPSALPIIDPVPSGTWKVCFKTDTELAASDALPKKYTVRLIDEKGLSSAPKEAKTLGSIPDISGADTAWKNLKQAVEGAQEGGVITVMGNVKATNAPDNNGVINVTKSLTIKGKNGAVLDANSNHAGTPPGDAPSTPHRIFTVTGDKTELTLENLTLKNGYANPGGSTDYSYGGAISASQIKTLTLKNCVIEDCTAYGGGGISLNGGVEAVLESCTITGCQTTAASGGAIYASASDDKQPIVRIKGGEIKNNIGHAAGGAIDIIYGSLYINTDEEGNPDTMSTTTNIENNTLEASGGRSNNGGGIDCYWETGKPGKLKIYNANISCTVKAIDFNNRKANGAGIYVDGKGDVLLSSVELSGCEFDESGGQLDQKQGGGIYLRNGAEASIEDCTIESSTTANEGGGIYAVDSKLTIENTKIQNNRVEKKGGGLYVLATSADVNLTIKGTTEFENNSVNLGSSESLGGGIYMKGRSGKPVTAVMTGGEIKINQAQEGGGIYIDRYAAFTMTGGSLNNNVVPSDGKGGAVYFDGSTFTMSGSAKVDTSNPSRNDVYLKTGKMITLDGLLTGTAPVARITPENYEPAPGVFAQVLTGDITAGTAPNQNYKKFTVTPQTFPAQNWVVDESGKLKKP